MEKLFSLSGGVDDRAKLADYEVGEEHLPIHVVQRTTGISKGICAVR